MNFIWIEIWKFIKNNFMRIIIGTVLIMGLFVVFTRWNYVSELEDNQEISEDSPLRVDSAPAYFEFYIENPQDSIFTNHYIVEEYFTHPNVLKEASEMTDTNLFKLVEETENIAITTYNNEESKIIGVGRDGNSHLQKFFVNIGNEKDNLKIANFYFDYLNAENLPFLEGKEIYIYEEPKVTQIEEDVVLMEELTGYNLVKNIMIGLIFGVVVTTGMILLLSFFTIKLIYSFTYSLKSDDYFMLIDIKNMSNSEELEMLVDDESANKETIIISEASLKGPSFTQENSKNMKTGYNNILDVPNISEARRLIYVIEENKTTRKWYNNQRMLDAAYDIPTIVIQINSLKKQIK